MGTQRSEGFEEVDLAWVFVDEGEDAEPRAWGHDLALGRAVVEGDGVYRAHTVDPGVDYSALTARRVANVEDALIARIDRARRRLRAH